MFHECFLEERWNIRHPYRHWKYSWRKIQNKMITIKWNDLKITSTFSITFTFNFLEGYLNISYVFHHFFRTKHVNRLIVRKNKSSLLCWSWIAFKGINQAMCLYWNMTYCLKEFFFNAAVKLIFCMILYYAEINFFYLWIFSKFSL